MTRLVIVGAGGFAREVAWLVREINQCLDTYRFLGFVVTDLGRLTEHDSKAEVLGSYDWLQQNRSSVDALAIGIGTPQVRLRVAAELSERFPELQWPNLVHPVARFDRGTCELTHGNIICPGVIGTVNLRIGPFSVVNLSCTIGHEAKIGAGCVLNPTANISGGVDLGAGTLVGTGAQILQYVKVGEGSTIGAGAVVTKDVAPGETVVGVPAKPMGSRH